MYDDLASRERERESQEPRDAVYRVAPDVYTTRDNKYKIESDP